MPGISNSEYWITGVFVRWKDMRPPEVLKFYQSEKIGMHSKHFPKKGISLRRNDTREEFAFLESGSWSRLKWLWNKPPPEIFDEEEVARDLEEYNRRGESLDRKNKIS